MEKLQCLICHDDVRVPVSFKQKCFPCPVQRGKPGCHSTLRVCLLCARQYLELNKPFRQRKASLKCLLCPTVGNPQKLKGANDAYIKDYMYMSIDLRSDYACFHSTSGCAFKGTQNELDRHIQNECQYRMTTCQCNALYRVVDAQEHFASCAFYHKCPVCATYVLWDGYHAHLSSAHQLVACRHVGCDKLMSLAAQESHMARECPYRSLRCDLCSNLKRVCDYKDHLVAHIQQHQMRMVQLTGQLSETQRLWAAATEAYTQWVMSPESISPD